MSMSAYSCGIYYGTNVYAYTDYRTGRVTYVPVSTEKLEEHDQKQVTEKKELKDLIAYYYNKDKVHA